MLHKTRDHPSSLAAVCHMARARGVDDVALLIEIAETCRVTGLSAPLLAWFLLWTIAREEAQHNREVEACLDRSRSVR